MIIDSKTEPTMGILISRNYCCKKDVENTNVLLTFWKNISKSEKQIVKILLNLSQISDLGGIVGAIINLRSSEFRDNGYESYSNINTAKLSIMTPNDEEVDLIIDNVDTQFGKRIQITVLKSGEQISIILCGKEMGISSHCNESIQMTYDILDIPLMRLFTGLYSFIDLDSLTTHQTETSVVSFINMIKQIQDEKKIDNQVEYIDINIRKEKICKIIASKLNTKREDLSLEMQLIKDLNAGSLDFIDLAFTLEYVLNTKVDEQYFFNLKTVGDVVNYVCDCAEKIYVKRH